MSRVSGSEALAEAGASLKTKSLDEQIERPIEEMTAAEQVDLYGDLDLWRRQHKRMLDRYEELKDALKARLDSQPALATPSLEGARWTVEAGKKAYVRSWRSILVLYRAFGGLKKFLAACQVTIEAATEQMGKEKAESLLVGDNTGSRRLTAIPLVRRLKAV